ncbi:MAG: DUF5107 domain-containing protein [Clostridiales bacterium]|nr:DUF5107 domain-containing protein [Clostridiales bacterium]
MEHRKGCVEVWEEQVVIPTYEVGVPDQNPMFLEKRVYQGSSGKVYPLPVIDKIYDEKVDKTYRALFLENDYLHVMLLPELGGRIQRALDKTNGYDFVYYNEVIKPALVGLTGPWISGGIEFNWPQHHRPTTYCPVDYLLCKNPDGSKTVRINEVDQMYGTKGMASFTLYPDKAYIEIRGQLYNRTPLPQTFLWWANPAVSVNDDTQSIFPPDVRAVMDHGKRAVSRFPIATGVYYKHDYGEGVDISRYKNIPVPTSYMAYHSDYDFVGGYDYGKEAGILHVADHHISPGKKQWTWGCGDFGKAWDRNLTDANGPYIELMTGVFTDNQPDFSWLKPFEEKSFVQYFMPYKKAAGVKNASAEAALNLECTNGTALVCVYATARYEDARITLTHGDQALFSWQGTLSPTDVFHQSVDIGEIPESRLTLRVYAPDGRLMLQYTPQEPSIAPQPEPAQAALSPEQIPTNEELLLTALHLEQYRHATYAPDPYYLEGLKRDPLDSRINNAYGMLLLRRGQFMQAEEHFQNAIKRLIQRNPNPYDSEPYYNLGLALFYQERFDEAFGAFYKATWTSAQQEMSFYYLAAISARRDEPLQALAFLERALIKNSRNIKARALKGSLLAALGKPETEAWLRENISIDPFDYLSRWELEMLLGTDGSATISMMKNSTQTLLGAARDYAEAGNYHKALAMLAQGDRNQPLLRYYQAAYAARAGQDLLAGKALAAAAACNPKYTFPNHLEDIAILTHAMEAAPEDARAPYYLGNLLYDRKRYQEAKALWERSRVLDDTFPTVWRNLALVYYNKDRQLMKAQEAMERAFALDPTDARVLLELDQLYKANGMSPADRLAFLDTHEATYQKRDDLYVEYITLLNLMGQHQQALERIMARKFHPWEGGEGKVTTQYTLALLQLARQAMADRDWTQAETLLKHALVFPESLGEGKLEGAKDNHLYYTLGCVYEAAGRLDEAKACWQLAALGDTEPKGMMYYNDQPADLILYQGLALEKLGDTAQARARYHKLIDYGETHLFDDVHIEYFAVSLPNLQIFEEDLTVCNRAHCAYLIALGSHGLGDTNRARSFYDQVLSIDRAHLGATLHRRLLDN